MKNFQEISKIDQLKALVSFKYNYLNIYLKIRFPIVFIHLIFFIFYTLNSIVGITLIMFFYFNTFFLMFYHIFFIFIIPFFHMSKIFYNSENRSINFSQRRESKKYSWDKRDKEVLFVSATYYSNVKEISAKKNLKTLVPILYANLITLYTNGVLGSKLLSTSVNFLIFWFFFFISFSFLYIDVMLEIKSSENYIFFTLLLLLLLFLMLTSKIILNKHLYYLPIRRIKKTISFYRKYFLIDYIVNAVYIEPKQVQTNKKVNNEGLWKHFLSIYLGLVLSIYIPLIYDKIYNVNVNVKTVEKSILELI